MPAPVSRRHFLSLSVTAVGSAALLGPCGGSDDGVSSGGNVGGDMGTAAPTNIGGSLTWGAWANPGEAERFRWYASEYKKKYGTDVKFQVVTGDYQAKLMTQLAGGSAPDVFYVGDGQMAKLIETGKLVDLTEYLASADARVKKEDIFPGLMSFCSPTGPGIYGLPNDCNPAVVWYNSDLLKAAGYTDDPATQYESGAWKIEAFEELLAKAKAAGKRGMIFESGWTAMWQDGWARAFGGNMFADDGHGDCILDQDEGAMKSVEWLWKMMDQGLITYGGSPPQGQGVVPLLYARLLACINLRTWILPTLRKLKFAYDIAPFPTVDGKMAPAPLFSSALAVNTDAKDLKVAQAFLGNYVNKDGQRARLAGGGNSCPSIAGLEDLVTEGDIPKHGDYFNQLSKIGFAVPKKVISQPVVSANLGTVMDKYIKDKVSAKEFATKITSYINTGKE